MDEIPSRVNCSVCGKSLSATSDMLRHMKLHLDPEEREKHMVYCSYQGCTYKNLQKANVDTHYRTHFREKSRHCPVKGCHFSTSDPGSLTRHRRSLHGYEPKPRNYLPRPETPKPTAKARKTPRVNAKTAKTPRATATQLSRQEKFAPYRSPSISTESAHDEDASSDWDSTSDDMSGSPSSKRFRSTSPRLPPIDSSSNPLKNLAISESHRHRAEEAEDAEDLDEDTDELLHEDVDELLHELLDDIDSACDRHPRKLEPVQVASSSKLPPVRQTSASERYALLDQQKGASAFVQLRDVSMEAQNSLRARSQDLEAGEASNCVSPEHGSSSGQDNIPPPSSTRSNFFKTVLEPSPEIYWRRSPSPVDSSSYNSFA